MFQAGRLKLCLKTRLLYFDICNISCLFFVDIPHKIFINSIVFVYWDDFFTTYTMYRSSYTKNALAFKGRDHSKPIWYIKFDSLSIESKYFMVWTIFFSRMSVNDPQWRAGTINVLVPSDISLRSINTGVLHGQKCLRRMQFLRWLRSWAHNQYWITCTIKQLTLHFVKRGAIKKIYM